MIPASASGLPFAPEVAPAPQFDQENLGPNLIPSSGYYDVSSHDEMPESHYEDMRHYG